MPKQMFKMLAAAGVCWFAGAASGQSLPPVFGPESNPITPEKAQLGKILFWDAQLSSDSTTSCGSCHQFAAGGGDARSARHPGVDGVFGNADDALGSPGVVSQDGLDVYLRSALFGLGPQVTPRRAPTVVNAAYAPELFWDGRAGLSFSDPVTGEVLVPNGAALENQAVGPPVNSVEMAHAERDWASIVEKLRGARPLALADAIPGNIAGLVGGEMTYPDLFERAFGDDAISAGRIGMALATYQRTLIADQTPFDGFIMGDTDALTDGQRDGMNALFGSACIVCHRGVQLTNHAFRNIGLRPIEEDVGRMAVTGVFEERGHFKTPTIRGAGLRDRFMHNGMLGSLEEVLDFYARRNGQVSFEENRDPVLAAPIVFAPEVEPKVLEFIRVGLTDPRVAGETFPFDRPALLGFDLPANPALIGGGVAGGGGVVPTMVALTPPHLGNDAFKVGVDHAPVGATAWVAVSESAPIGGVVAGDELVGPITLADDGSGVGYGTARYPIPDDLTLDGVTVYMQWVIEDPGAPGGESRSDIARVDIFCSMNGTCVRTCAADLNGDSVLDFGDVSVFLSLFQAADAAVDFDGSGAVDFGDVSAFLALFGAGCP